MSSWWSNLNRREKIILLVALVVALFILIDTFLVGPYRMRQQMVSDQLQQAQDDLAWMQRAIGRLPSRSSARKSPIRGSLVNFVNQQINRQGLKKQMQQMTPIKDHSVRVRLADVEFSQLLKLFTAFQGSAAEVREVRILPTDQQGLVGASLVISNGGSKV